MKKKPEAGNWKPEGGFITRSAFVSAKAYEAYLREQRRLARLLARNRKRAEWEMVGDTILQNGASSIGRSAFPAKRMAH